MDLSKIQNFVLDHRDHRSWKNKITEHIDFFQNPTDPIEFQTRIQQIQTWSKLPRGFRSLINSVNWDDCPICLDPLCAKEQVKLGCHHQFHMNCMYKYLFYSLSDRCPMCRQNIESIKDDCSDQKLVKIFKKITRKKFKQLQTNTKKMIYYQKLVRQLANHKLEHLILYTGYNPFQEDEDQELY